MTRLPPLSSLRAFEAVVRRGSISAAARDLGVTHGAVSQQIRTLETALGRPLFHRSGKRLSLNADGKAYYPAVGAAFAGLVAATERLKPGGAMGRLRIACVPALLTHWLLPRAGNFMAQNPGVSLHLAAANDPDLLVRGSVDLALIYGTPVPGLWSRQLAEVRLMPVASPVLLARMPRAGATNLADHTLLHSDNGEEWSIWFKRTGGAYMAAREHFLADARLALEAAMHGYGIALGDEVTAAAALASGELVRISDQVITAPGAFHLLCREEGMHQAAMVSAVDWLMSEAASTPGS